MLTNPEVDAHIFWEQARAVAKPLETIQSVKFPIFKASVLANGVPASKRVETAALLRSNGVITANTLKDYDQLLELDKLIMQHRGQPAVWEYRYNEPHKPTVQRSSTSIRSVPYLHTGILTEDAKIEVNQLGQLAIPIVSKASYALPISTHRKPFAYTQVPEATKPEAEPHNRPVDAILLDHGPAQLYRVPILIGSAAVQQIVNNQSLPEVAEALQAIIPK